MKHRPANASSRWRSRPTYASTRGLTAGSTSVATDRSYSRYWGSTSPADRHHAVRVLAVQDLAHPPLVRRVDVRVQEADTDDVDAELAQLAGDAIAAGSSKRPAFVGAEVPPSTHGTDELHRHDPRRLH